MEESPLQASKAEPIRSLFEEHEDYSELENEEGDGDGSTQPFNEAHFLARLFELDESAQESLRGSVRVNNYGINHTA